MDQAVIPILPVSLPPLALIKKRPLSKKTLKSLSHDTSLLSFFFLVFIYLAAPSVSCSM